MERHRLNILLVDDDEDDFVMTRGLIAEIPGARFSLDWAATYPAALEAIGRNAHDVYLLDYRLGERSGLDLLREALRNGCKAPMILLTGQEDHEVDVEAMKAGAADYLVKGRIDAPLLERSIRYAIEHRRGEEALRESEEKFRSIVETTNEWIWAIDRQGRMTYNNPAVEAILGYAPAELLGKGTLKLLHDEDQREVRGMLPRHLAEKRGWTSLVLRWRHKDGTYRYLEGNAVPILNADGEVEGFRGTDRDMTQRKQAEKALEAAEKRLHAVVTHLPVMLIALNSEGVITLAEGKGLQMMGFTPGEIIGKSAFDVYQSMPEFLEKINGALVGEAFDWVVEVAGTQYETHCQPLRDASGEYRGVIGIAVDVTERQRAEAEKQRLRTQVIQSEKLAALGELVAGVAHEINNPLAAISGTAELLEMSRDADTREDAQTIRRMAERATRIVRSLLTFARCDDNARCLITLRELIESALEICAGKIRKADIELTLCLEDDTPVLVNDNQIQQILVNLVNNAEHALRQKEGEKRIVITTDLHDEPNGASWATISVADNGCGISEETQGRIFDPFFTTKDVGEGTGLGLSICHGIAEAHGGRLSVESTPGAGTSFTLALPIATALSAQEGEYARAA